MLNLVKTAPFLLMVVALFALPEQVEAQRNRLEARVSGNSRASGKAKYESRGRKNRQKFSLEIEDAAANAQMVVQLRRNGRIIVVGSFKTNQFGFADFNLDTDLGHHVVGMESGDEIQVRHSTGAPVASGILRGR